MASPVILSCYLAAGWKPIEKPKSLSALEGRWIMKKNQVRLTCSSCFLNSWSCCCKQRERKKMLKLWRGKFLTVDTILCDWVWDGRGFFPFSMSKQKKKTDDHTLLYLWCRGHIFFPFCGRTAVSTTTKNPPQCTVCCCLWCVFDPQKNFAFSPRYTFFEKEKHAITWI